MIKWEIAIVKLEVEEIEFEEGRMEVVQLVVNHHQLSSNGVDPEVVGTKAYDLAFEQV